VGIIKKHGIHSPFVFCGGFDLRGFDRTSNGGIVLNDVCGIASYIIKYRGSCFKSISSLPILANLLRTCTHTRVLPIPELKDIANERTKKVFQNCQN
jgi:hypothetical protein